MERIGTKALRVGDTDVESGRGPGQMGWYEFATQIIQGKKVLDAGCGLGNGVKVLRRVNPEVLGQDLDPRLKADWNIIVPLHDIPAKSFDVVTSIDVIEHVEDDKGFLAQLCRIAREAVFVTTPNWTISRCQWPYHLREYTPRELELMLEPYGTVRLFKGNGPGSIVYPVRYPTSYHVTNMLRAARLSAFPTRCINHVLPESWRILGHNAALLTLF